MDDNYALDQDAQIHVTTIGNYCGIILENKGQHKEGIRDNQQQQPKHFPSSVCRVFFVFINDH